MLKSLRLIIICAVALPAFCELSPKHELATILFKPHQSGDSASAAVASYDVSVKVAGTPGTRRKEHHHLQRHFRPIGRSTDHQPEAGHNEPVEVIT